MELTLHNSDYYAGNCNFWKSGNWVDFCIHGGFSSFFMRIPVSLEMLLTNRKNLVVDEVSLFEKELAFWKLIVRIRKILCAKVVRQIVALGNFPALWLVFVVFPASD